MTGIRQLTLVLVLALASFGALFAAGRAGRDSEPQAAPPRAVAVPAASVSVASLKTTSAIPALRERKVKHKKAAPAPSPSGGRARGNGAGGHAHSDSDSTHRTHAGARTDPGTHPHSDASAHPRAELRRFGLIR